jgi:hypothetical protein
LTVWIIAGLLGMATGLRIGWALVNRQSVVSAAMIVALGNLAVVAILNWPPVALLVNSALGWPNIAVALSQVTLVASAAGSCVMITSVAAANGSESTRRLAVVQYAVAAVIAVATLMLFLGRGREPEMAPKEYLTRTVGLDGATLDWLIPLLYVLLVLSVVAWVGVRLSSATRRGRALLLFTAGMALIVVAIGCLVTRSLRRSELAGLGTALSLLLSAMAVVAVGALLPTLEDWIGARLELRLLEPLRKEMERRQPDVGIGVRPRGPLVFRVAERLSLISDAIYLEGLRAQQAGGCGDDGPHVDVGAAEQARAVAVWISAGSDQVGTAFPGRCWLRQPDGYPDRDWILEIARQYRELGGRAVKRR